jgi:hypothetical protein
MTRFVWRFILIFACLIILAGAAQPIGLAATPAISPQACAPLPPPSGTIVNVSTVPQLVSAVNSATSGTTIVIANGTYNLNGEYLRLAVPNVALRSASGNREAVILDGNYQTTEIIQIAASNVTVADVTLREAYYHPIHVMSGDAAHTLNTLIYNVHIIDPGEQAIKINPATAGYYTDNGTIACSHIELTDAGRPYIRNNCYTGGIDAHQSRNWIIRDNLIEGFWCSSGLAEHGIHLWRGCRDTLVERNALRNNARGIGFGLVTDGSGRTYPDNPCPAATGYVDDFGGVIRNNFVYANSASLFSSEYGFDCGICAWNSCNARLLHNTVYSTDPAHTFSSIEWRFSNTIATLINNLVNDDMRQRDGAQGTLSNNLTTAQAGWFVNAATGDLHLLSTATAAIDRVAAPAEVGDDIDGDLRPIGNASDIGADEYGIPAPLAVIDLRVTRAFTASNILTATLRWTAPAHALTTTLRYSGTLIAAANWNSATPLTNDLSGTTAIFTATAPYQTGVVYFALKTQNETDWSPLSNNTFWPQQFVYLPVIFKNSP